MKLFLAVQSRFSYHKLLTRDIFRSGLISVTMYDYYAADIIIRHPNYAKCISQFVKVSN